MKLQVISEKGKGNNFRRVGTSCLRDKGGRKISGKYGMSNTLLLVVEVLVLNHE
ncbi:MAG: hypothetical protein HFH82_07630 [Lachnospiraceae bacterium]|nr:hypothetical protein [Lachnospiraceae bacterium]